MRCASSATSRRATAFPRAACWWRPRTAAGIPLLAAKVGGIPEILGPHTAGLFAPDSVGAMADAIEGALIDLDAARLAAKELRERIFTHFSQRAMVDGVLSGYRDAFEAG